jgi:hypothetical protein
VVAFCLAACLALLAVLGLISLGPWGRDSLAPHLSVAPGIGVALEDAVVVAPARRPGVGADLAAARVARGGRSSSAAIRAGAPHATSASQLGVSAARPVQSAATAAPPVASPGPQSPQPQPVSSPAAPPAESSSAPQPPEPQIVDAAPEQEPEGSPSRAAGSAGAMGRTGPAHQREPIVVRLSGDQSSSEPIPVGEGEGGGAVQIREGDEYALAFSFYIETMVYGEPGAPNLFMQMVGDASPSPSFGLQLWDYAGADGSSGGRGLWSTGDAMGGDRFLAPVSEGAWHKVVLRFCASSEGAGYYALYLDGQPIDVRLGVSMIPAGSSYAQIEIGLFRDGDVLPGTSEIWIDAVTLSEALESVPLR